MWHLQRQALQSKACQALKVVTILQHLLGFCATPRLLVCPFNWNQMKDDERIYEYWIMIIMEIHPSRAETQKPSKTNCHRHSICVTSMTRNYMMKGFPPSPSQFCSWLKTLAKILFSQFSICFVLWWLQNLAQREIQVVRYQPDESQVPHVDTSTLVAFP